MAPSWPSCCCCCCCSTRPGIAARCATPTSGQARWQLQFLFPGASLISAPCPPATGIPRGRDLTPDIGPHPLMAKFLHDSCRNHASRSVLPLPYVVLPPSWGLLQSPPAESCECCERPMTDPNSSVTTSGGGEEVRANHTRAERKTTHRLRRQLFFSPFLKIFLKKANSPGSN